MDRRVALLAAVILTGIVSGTVAVGRLTTPASVAPSQTARPSSSETPAVSPSSAPGTVTLAGAGDIASCASDGDAATAKILAQLPGTTIFTAGDNAYERGTAAEYASCYAPTWGAFKDRTRPAPGNHDYLGGNAGAYFDYFGVAAGERGKGYYSYDIGAWHVVVLDSECAFVGGCGITAPQVRWLDVDLAQARSTCSLAIFHHPRFSSGAEHGSDATYDAFWRVLYAHGVELVINGHDHDYERFAPQTPDAVRDDARGIREFVVGTGGRSLYAVGTPIANSEVLRNDTYGVLALTLRATGYDWRFIPVEGSPFSDAGSGGCH